MDVFDESLNRIYSDYRGKLGWRQGKSKHTEVEELESFLRAI